MSRRTERIATTEDVLAIVHLVNSAYRGETSKKGWTTEEHLLGGQRLDADRAAEMIRSPGHTILLWPSLEDESQIDSCVLLEIRQGFGYLGMLTVRPDLQNAGLGRLMLESSEKFFREKGLSKIQMTVIDSRSELIAWYQRRGYRLTGETQEFPMKDARFGIPKTNHLQFVVMEKELR